MIESAKRREESLSHALSITYLSQFTIDNKNIQAFVQTLFIYEQYGKYIPGTSITRFISPLNTDHEKAYIVLVRSPLST